LATRFHREFAALSGLGLRQYQLRYILAKLTQHVDLVAYGRNSEGHKWLSRYTDGTNVHIEHVLPQTLDDVVRTEFGEGADDRELLWSIGNLALVEKSINASLGRRPFSAKRPVYPQSQYLLTRAIAARPEIGNTAIDRAVSSMTPFTKWDRAAVQARAVQLALLAAEVWGVPNASAPDV
jgi:hypothetical protein